MASLPDTGSSADFFFRQDSTLEALTHLSSQRHIIVYCGTGVSIDRTGMSWSALVRAIFNSATANLDDRHAEMGAIRRLISELSDQQQAASIVVQAYLASDQNENEFLASKLKDILYERSGWDRGLMIRHLARVRGVGRDTRPHGRDHYYELRRVPRAGDRLDLGSRRRTSDSGPR